MSADSTAYENSFVQAMRVIAGAAVQGYKADQTVIGVIRGAVRDNIYEVSYNGGLMTCYAEDKAIFMPGSSVYILVPQGDFSQKKTIVGLTSSSSGEEGNLSVVAPALDGYEVISNNILTPTSKWGKSTSIKISSYKEQFRNDFQDIATLYQVAGKGWEPKTWVTTVGGTGEWAYNQYYTLDVQKAKIYSSAAKGFMLKADFRTNLPSEQVRSETPGDYGIIIALRFASENTVYKTMKEKWEDIVPQTDYYFYEKNSGYFHRTLDFYKDKIYSYTEEDGETGVFFEKIEKEGQQVEPTLADVQDRIITVKNELEAFISQSKKELSEKGIELCNSYSKWLEQISVYQKDEKNNPMTKEKLLDIYKKWFTDELDPSDQNFEKIVRYEFGTNNMLGDPYCFNDGWYTQRFIQPVDFKNFSGIEGIYFYCRDFSHTTENKDEWKKTIKVKDVNFYFLDTIDEEDSDYKLELEYPDGKIFDTFSSSEEIKVKGKLIYQKEHNYTSRCTINWFKEDPKIKSFEDEGYNHWAGAGWKKIESDQKNTSDVTMIFNAADNKSYENHYLCVATQSLETILKAKFTLYNAASKKDIEIISDSGTNFGSGGNSKTLTCLINQKQYNFDELYEDSHYRFKWQKTVNGNTTYYEKTESELIEEINSLATSSNDSERSLYNVQLSNTRGVSWENNQLIFPSNQVSPNEEVTITCVVEFNPYPVTADASLLEEWAKVGEASIVLTEQVAGNIKGYNIEIENGNQVFQYSESGISPCSERYEQPYEVRPLTCAFYSPNGGIVDSSKYTVKWMWPLENTMLIIDSNLAVENTNTGTKNLYDQKTCPVTIAEEYDMNAANNQITCIVEFGGAIYYKETSFYFGKAGENGSNATEVVAKITPIVNMTTNSENDVSEPLTLHVYSNPNRKIVPTANDEDSYLKAIDGSINPYIYRWNNGELNTEACLGLQLYRNNTLIDPNEYKSIKWEIAGTNNLTSSRMSVEGSSTSLEQYESCYITYNHSLEDDNINTYCHNHTVKASVGLDIKDTSDNTVEQKYYAYYPIPIIVHEKDIAAAAQEDATETTEPYSLGINKNKTLRQIMYNNEGRSPQYNKNQGVFLNFGSFPEKDNSSRTIEWSTGGGIDYTTIEVPIDMNPKTKGLYELPSESESELPQYHYGYKPTEDAVVEKDSEGHYKKYFKVDKKYTPVFNKTSITLDPLISTNWKTVSVSLDSNPSEEELWEKSGTTYKLTTDTQTYEYKIISNDLVSIINPSYESWCVKFGDIYRPTSDAKVNTSWYGTDGKIKQISNDYGYFKLENKYTPVVITDEDKNKNPYKQGWFEELNGSYVRSMNSKIEDGVTYYSKKSMSRIEDLKKEIKPYYQHFYVKDEDNNYFRATDITYKKDNYYYYKALKNKKYYTYEGYRQILGTAFDAENDEYIGIPLLNCNPKEQGWYEKTNDNEYVLTKDTSCHAYAQVQSPRTPRKRGYYIFNKDKNVYQLTSDEEVNPNQTYYLLKYTGDLSNANSKKKIFYELVTPQIPCVKGWYTWDSTNEKFVLSEDMVANNNKTYFEFTTDLDEDIAVLLKENPLEKNWYGKNGEEYVLTPDQKIGKESTYYQLFTTVSLVKSTNEFFTTKEGSYSPFLKLLDPESEEESLVNLIQTTYLPLEQAEKQTKELQKQKEEIERKWALESQKLYNHYRQNFIQKDPDHEDYPDDGSYVDIYTDNNKLSFYVEKETASYPQGEQNFTSEDMRRYYFERQNDILEEIAKIDELVQEELTVSLGNTISVIPSDIYDGETANNYIIAKIYKNNFIDGKWEKGELEYTVYIPIHLYLNTYGLSSLNGWDGNSVEINENEKYILAPQIGAGKKNVEDNTFTGLVMGREKTYNQDNSPEERIGLLGYNHGKQSIWMDAETGKTILGLPEDDAVHAGNPLTEGRIELVPGGTSRISRWRFDSRSLYRVLSKDQTDYLDKGLDINRLYTNANFDNEEDFEELSEPYKTTKYKYWQGALDEADARSLVGADTKIGTDNQGNWRFKIVDKNNKPVLDESGEEQLGDLIGRIVTKGTNSEGKAPINAHGSIPHDQQGMLLSAAPTYLSIKGKPFGEPGSDGMSPEGIDYSDPNTMLEPGDSLEVQIDPNGRSVFAIYAHLNPKNHYLQNLDGKYVGPAGNVVEQKENAEKQATEWFRIPRVGIDNCGRFFTNALKDKTTTLILDSLGAFGVSAASKTYTGAAVEVSDNTLIKMFTYDVASGTFGSGAKTNPLFFSSSSDFSSNGSEGLRPIGMYSGEYFNIFVGDNNNNKEPDQAITTLRLTDKNKEILLGTSINNTNETGKINGSIIYKKDEKGEDVKNLAGQNIPELPRKAELKLKHNERGHLLHAGDWTTYITKQYDGFFNDIYTETIEGEVTHIYNNNLKSHIKKEIEFNWNLNNATNTTINFGNVKSNDISYWVHQLYFNNRDKYFTLHQRNSSNSITTRFELSGETLPALYNLKDNPNWYNQDSTPKEKASGIRLMHKGQGNIKILQSSKSSNNFESYRSISNNVSQESGILLSSWSNYGIGLYAEPSDDTDNHVAFTMMPSEKASFYLDAAGGSYLKHDIPGKPRQNYKVMQGSYVKSFYSKEQNRKDPDFDCLPAPVQKAPKEATEDQLINIYNINGVEIGPTILTNAAWITGRFGVEELVGQDWSSWADEAGLYVSEGIMSGHRIWSEGGIFAGFSSATNKSAAYMKQNGEIHATRTGKGTDDEPYEGGIIFADRMQDPDYASPGVGSSGFANDGLLGTNELVKWAKEHTHPFKKGVQVNLYAAEASGEVAWGKDGYAVSGDSEAGNIVFTNHGSDTEDAQIDITPQVTFTGSFATSGGEVNSVKVYLDGCYTVSEDVEIEDGKISASALNRLSNWNDPISIGEDDDGGWSGFTRGPSDMGITVVITGYEEVSMSGSVVAKVVANDEYDYIEGESDPCSTL